MSRQDLENVTKAAQAAALLRGDLLDVISSENPLLSDAALAEAALVNLLCSRLERLQANLETMASKS